MRGVVVIGEVEEQEVEAVAGHEPAPDRGGVRVDRPAGAIPERKRGAGSLALEQVVEEEPLGAANRAEEGDRRPVHRPTAIGREVDGRRLEAGIGKSLEHGDRALAEVIGVHPDERVAKCPPQARRSRGAER